MEKHIIFDGHKFTRDDKTGYYLKSTKPRKRLHIYVWEYYNGPVPKGCHIHHKDMNKNNNDISNLICVTRTEHNRIHSESLTEEERERRRENMNKNVRPKAIEWHKSEAGKEWHREQYKVSLDQARLKKVKKKCIICGTEYEIGSSYAYKSKFCSNNCKSKYRRLIGIDNIEKVCTGCGKTYKVNRYHAEKQLYCSKKCADRYGRKRSLL